MVPVLIAAAMLFGCLIQGSGSGLNIQHRPTLTHNARRFACSWLAEINARRVEKLII